MTLRRGRGAALAGLLVALVACGAPSHQHGGEPVPVLHTTSEVAAWLQARTGGCTEPRTATPEQLAEFLGPQRAALHVPFVAEWATCAVPPYERLGLLVFRPDGAADLQRSWLQALADGSITDDPDLAFGDGFALTGYLGLEHLGLRHLRCTPPDPTDVDPVPAETPGCRYTPIRHHDR